MNFRLLAFFLLLVATIHSVSAETTTTAPTSIKVAIGYWPPYFGEKLPDYGVGAKLITEAFAAVEIKVDYVFSPWNRSLEGTRSGWTDATGGWSQTIDRRSDFYISKPLINSNTLLYYSKTRPLVGKSIKDLHGLRIGATLGYFYGNEFELAEKNGEFKVIRAETDQTNLKNLALGRIDGFPLDEVVASYMMANDMPAFDAEKIVASSFSVNTNTLHLLVSRKIANGEELVRLFDQGLDTIHKNGTYDRIVNDPVFRQKR